MKNLRKIWFLLTLDNPRKLYITVIAIVVMSLFDMMGVASIFPFLSVMSDPEIIHKSHKIAWAYDRFGFTSINSFLIALGTASFVILIVSNVLRAVTMKSLIRFTWMKHQSIAKRLLAQYLYEPYAFFLNRNSSELTAYLMSEVARVVTGTLIPCMQIFARFLLIIFILGLLFLVNPLVVLLVLGVIGGGYAAIYLFFRNRIARTGEDFQKHSKIMYKTLNEAFGGIKDVKLMGKEHIFIEQYATQAKQIIHCYCSQFLIAQLPRYAFEAAAFGGILIIMMYMVIVTKDYQQIVPLVGLYALAAYRLMPALQQIFQDITSVRFSRSALNVVYNDFTQCAYKDREPITPGTERPLPFSKSIEFRKLTFQYFKASKPVIEDFDLLINANTTIGLVGSTGAGKTTIIDILLGLLVPQKGDILVDGEKVDEKNIRGWQKNLGYVPQHIYLCDDTVTRNIAFGVPDHEIDAQAVRRAALLANIHDFVEKELPDGYETEVGERGIRLSGGQRQRIGIARALYHNPPVIVFDEATSALDGITEEVILEAIHHLAHRKTIVIIAHRLGTVKECDCIYLLEQGRIVNQGTYQELLANDQRFRKMAKVA
ncbi:MAG: ABC transporter ATP-binding protein [Candidatus Omnitrophota bacterium]|nr:ABC transporter ATP-binding protein [Candidatus Omnitrophota bacterium]